MKKKVALLCDYGLDDALATLYLLRYAERFTQIDILPIGGNFPRETSFTNAKRLLTYGEAVPRQLRLVDTVTAPQSESCIPEIHGKDGMGDVLPTDYREMAPVISYEQWLSELDDSYVIVSLGPCTITRDILERKGALPLILMAGNVAEPPNYNGYEFNHGMDTAGFAAAVRYPHAVATLDTCHAPTCNLIGQTLPTEGLFARMLHRYLALSRGRGETVCSVYDMVAVVYLIHPERFRTEAVVDPQGNHLSLLRYISEKSILAD
ncbi:MAG: nucleoside hydrolase [Clostridia bacterium]|nr:nucleoside hydrolase [Clostridia bacterium]